MCKHQTQQKQHVSEAMALALQQEAQDGSPQEATKAPSQVNKEGIHA